MPYAAARTATRDEDAGRYHQDAFRLPESRGPPQTSLFG